MAHNGLCQERVGNSLQPQFDPYRIAGYKFACENCPNAAFPKFTVRPGMLSGTPERSTVISIGIAIS